MADPRRPDVINVYAGEWPEDPYPPTEGWLAKWRGLIPQGHDLGLSLYELQPQQTQSPYHFHHASEELMLVLRGRPTLRTADGERELQPGDLAHFPRGAAGAHQVVNRTDEPALYVIGSSNSSPDICEYPDSGKLLAMSRGESQRGERLWTVHRLEDGVDYLDGEEPRA
jgi:uncharacterized cupin superfamily protein